MKKILLLGLLTCAPVFAAAPDSVAGKIFRDRVTLPSLSRSSWERTILLETGGTCNPLVIGRGQAVYSKAPYQIFLHDPNPLGYSTYIYTRTGESTATLEFRNVAGTRVGIYQLIFTSDTGGELGFLESGQLTRFTLTDPAQLEAAPICNTSVRGRVISGHPLIAGFIVPGTAQREVLVRVAGPALVPFGLTDVWTDPDFQIYQGSTPLNRNSVHYGDWSIDPPVPSFEQISPLQAFQKIFADLGAFPFAAGSKDAAEVVRLIPGAYTIVASAAPGDPGGDALIEVYVLP